MSKLSDAFISDLTKYIQRIARNMAKAVSDDMINEYITVINRFYSSYEPTKYRRHVERGQEPGLLRTYERFYKDPHGTMAYGGIKFSTAEMYSDYKTGEVDTLESFLEGFHGPRYAHIEFNIMPYDHMVKYRDLIAHNIQQYVDEAELEARGAGYRVLQF